MKTSVIYSRVSSVTDRQNTDRQISDLKTYAERNELNVISVYSEHISGAKRNEERTVLMECLDYCVTNKIDTLLLSELSRLGRSTLQVLKSLDILHSNGVNVYIQNLNLNTLLDNKEVNPLASIVITVLAEMASIERSNIVYRLQSGRANYISNGGSVGRKKGSVKSLEQKKEEYKDVISHLKKGISVRNVAKLTNKGVATVQRIKTEFNI
ncbi:MAG: recombinase family protein [Parabacteroides sp.]|nr:recombinase family protein [Parabacteroides sp.]